MAKTKTPNYFPILIIVADIILISCLIWSVSKINSLSNQNAILRGQLDDVLVKKKQLLTDQTESSRLADSLQILDGYFLAPEQRVVVIDDLEKMAGQAKITYTLNNALDGDQTSLDMSVKGPFQNIYYFIRLLEENNYWVSFDKLALSRGTDKVIGTWAGSIVISIPNTTK